ncbi:MAG: hypothetical protein EXQ96_09825 [Alphaproteobacteria bacterium]|nr:hypothetical protein [Alphaproteobacteria bacterium]
MAPGAEGEGAVAESVIHVEVSQKTPDTHAAIRHSLEAALKGVRAAVTDWRPMLAKLDAIIATLAAEPPSTIPPEDFAESLEFLRWARDNHFTLLGFREYDLVERSGEIVLDVVPDSALGIMRARAGQRVSTSFAALPREVQDRARQPNLLIITKANQRATVHRSVYMDYIGIKKFDSGGRVAGEWRFLGLFTSSVYSRNTRDIPLLRRKVNRAILRSGLGPLSHDGKALLHILETLPRDELFQTSDDDLNTVAQGVLELQDRQRTRLFVRRDNYGRFFSCLVYVPRERYSTEIRQRISEVLTRAFHGKSIDFTAQVSDDVLARLHFIVRVEGPRFPDVDLPEVEAAVIKATRHWGDDLRDALIDAHGEARGGQLYATYGASFPAAYREDYQAPTAVGDVEKFAEVGATGTLGMNLYTRVEAEAGQVNFKIYHAGAPVPLSDILPMLESMGLKVEEEKPYQVKRADDGGVIWVHDFVMTLRRGGDLDVTRIKADFQETFGKVWAGEVENDGFNQLVLSAGLGWREVAVLRAYCKYRRQANIIYSQPYMEATLNANPAIARLLVQLFHARFDPARPRDAQAEAALAGDLEQALDKVVVLDQDRIIRRFLNLIQATVRTSYYQRPMNGQRQSDHDWKSYISFKLESRRVEGLPAPVPLYEVWVYSPRVEAVHLRGGKVARGGIRWSDRFEDFRTKVLGLMKAQMVKNAVIVPVGAKGGFVVKRPPPRVAGARR